jgi:hypothetical protein
MYVIFLLLFLRSTKCINFYRIFFFFDYYIKLVFIDIFQIWNHPDILYKIMRQKKTDLADEKDLDIETETSGGKKRGKKASAAATQPGLSPFTDKKSDQVITYEWVIYKT